LLVHHELKVYLGETFQFQPGAGHDVTSGLADVLNLSAKEASGVGDKDFGLAFAGETRAEATFLASQPFSIY
jgi:hypothetical protein